MPLPLRRVFINHEHDHTILKPGTRRRHSAQWKAVAQENQGRILCTRVRALSQPVITKKFRVVVTRVAPLAGAIARLLQVEAWGTQP